MKILIGINEYDNIGIEYISGCEDIDVKYKNIFICKLNYIDMWW